MVAFDLVEVDHSVLDVCWDMPLLHVFIQVIHGFAKAHIRRVQIGQQVDDLCDTYSAYSRKLPIVSQ